MLSLSHQPLPVHAAPKPGRPSTGPGTAQTCPQNAPNLAPADPGPPSGGPGSAGASTPKNPAIPRHSGIRKEPALSLPKGNQVFVTPTRSNPPKNTPRHHPSYPRRPAPDAIRGGHPPPPPTHPKLARKAPPGASRVFWKKLLLRARPPIPPTPAAPHRSAQPPSAAASSRIPASSAGTQHHGQSQRTHATPTSPASRAHLPLTSYFSPLTSTSP